MEAAAPGGHVVDVTAPSGRTSPRSRFESVSQVGDGGDNPSPSEAMMIIMRQQLELARDRQRLLAAQVQSLAPPASDPS